MEDKYTKKSTIILLEIYIFTVSSRTKVMYDKFLYKKGDCLSLKINRGIYLATIITQQYKEYYDFTLIQYWESRKATLSDFEHGLFFGTKAQVDKHNLDKNIVNVRMLAYEYVDSNKNIEKVGNLDIKDDLLIDGYAYIKTLEQLYEKYQEEIFSRVRKTENVQRFPDLRFGSHHLILVKDITKF